jgi:curved DNA-binding protein
MLNDTLTGLPKACGMLTLRDKSQPESLAEPELEISIDEAFLGVARDCEIAGLGRIGVRLPAGLRDGDLVELETGRGGRAPLSVRVRITPEPGRAILGNDLRLTLAVDPQLIERGGRVEVDTPYGLRTIWTPPALPASALHRIRDCGLPARGERSQGHAFVRLEPDPGLSGRIARALLDRFATAWTPDAPLHRARAG